MADKVTVDEPLISTDVDQLIRLLAEKKKISLGELRQTCKIDKKTLDKWIAVLEDEGYISVEYGLSGTAIKWKDDHEVVVSAPQTRQEVRQFSKPAPAEPTTELHELDSIETISPEESAIAQSEASADEAAGEEAEVVLRDYFASKKADASQLDDLKSNILASLGRTEKKEEPAQDETLEIEADEFTMEPSVEEEPEEILKPQREAAPGAAEMRELMNGYLAEINREKARVEALRKDREALYREKFTAIEGKMQADIVVLTERILEKQAKIAELKERVLELPDKVEELEKLQTQMDSLRTEGREALQRTRKKAEDYISSVQNAKSAVEKKINEIDSSLVKQAESIKQLETLGNSLDSKASRLRETVESAKVQVETLNSTVASLATDLQQIEEAKSNIASMTEDVKSGVATHGEELESLEQELEGIARMEQWVEEYVSDYEAKIEDIENYVSRGDEELSELREAAESVYMKKYLGELAEIAGAYQDQLGDAAAKDRSIEEKISLSQSRIADLVQDSHAMVKKLSGETASAKDFSSISARLKEQTARVKGIIGEKRQERARLVDDSRTTRKTRGTSVVGRIRTKIAPSKKKKRK